MSRRERQQAIVRMMDQGRALHIAGKKDEAEKIFRDVMALDANNAEAMHRMGLLLVDRGRFVEALPLMQRSLGLAPMVPELHNNMGELYRKAGMPGAARVSFLRAIELRPNFFEAINNLALTLVDLVASGDAIRNAQVAIKLAPNNPQVHYTLGLALSTAHQYVEAIAALKEAIRLDPTFEEARSRLIFSRAGAGESIEAIAADSPELSFETVADRAVPGYCTAGLLGIAEPIIDRVLAENPKNPSQLLNRGSIFKDRGDTRAALEWYQKSLENGGGAGALFNASLCQLKLGDLKPGFAGYELRSRPAPPLDNGALRPLWDGSDPAGKTILITHEQGFGDTFMFIRYASLLAARGARVWVQAVRSIHDLLKTVDGVSRLFDPADEPRGFQFCIPIVSMPFVFGTELSTIPANVPYIKADPARVAAWREKIYAHGSALRVGLVWQGNPMHRNDHRRSLALSALAPLAQVAGVKFFSLQKGKGSEQIGQPGAPPVIDLSADIETFSDTAAAMESLDLVIAVDTAVIHLAGAMGRPVWSLHALGADFRWMENRTDSPWYPTMKLYRQRALDDWQGVVGEVAGDLGALAAQKRI